MAYSRVVKKGNGVTTQFTVNFALGYLDPADVTCSVNGVGKPIQFMSANVIKVLGSPVANGLDIIFDRTVDKTALEVDFTDGDILNEKNLDSSQKQAFMAVHEVLDGKFGTIAANLDMGGNKITNLGYPTAATDAASKQYVDDTAGELAGLTDEIAALAAIDDAIVTVSGIDTEIAAVNTIAGPIAVLAANSAVLTGAFAALSVNEYTFTGNGVQTSFALGVTPVSKEHIDLFVGGAVQTLADFGLAGNNISIVPAPDSGVQIIAKVKIQVSSNQLTSIRDDAQAAATAASGSAGSAGTSAINASTSASTADNAKIAAVAARDQAIATANSVGPAVFFATKAAADAGIGSVAANAVIQVLADETQLGYRTLYQKVSGAYVFLRKLLDATAILEALSAPLPSSPDSSRTAMAYIQGPWFGMDPVLPSKSGYSSIMTDGDFNKVIYPGVYKITGSWSNGYKGAGANTYTGVLIVVTASTQGKVYQEYREGELLNYTRYTPNSLPGAWPNAWRANGSIIERGSNANGEYVKFADGTQICTVRAAAVNTVTAIGSVYTMLAPGSWTFPNAFLSGAVISMSVNTESSQRWGNGFAVDNTTASWTVFSAIPDVHMGLCILSATGKWR